jgi:glucose/arabinose dehydrogenase
MYFCSPRRWTVLAGLTLLVAPSLAGAAVLDPAFTEAPLAMSAELAGATSLAWAPDGSNRLFVTRKGGAIQIIKDGVLLAAPFATVTPIYDQSECGLLGIAFDPDFLANRYLYVFATVSATEQQIIRYTVTGDTGVDKTTIVAGLPTAGVNHDGGALGFGADGKLYWGIGDLGNSTGVQADLASMAAKIGRANLDGTPVSDNPYFDGAGPNADHIWARGFRNPFTLTFQPSTGLLWIQDVGADYEQIFTVRRGDHAGWNLYENNQPDGYILPVIKYRTNDVDTRTIAPAAQTGASRTGGMVTFITTEPHTFRLGEKITVQGVDVADLNGDYFVASIPGATSFRAPRPGPDAVGGGGTATTQAIGGCVTGGAFYEATGFPASHRGNFFFGDYNTRRIERVVIDAAGNTVTSVDHWAEGLAGAVDVALGPDGALYYVGLTSNAVYRTSYNATSQGLVVSPTHLWLAEGQRAMFMVRLAVSPAADVTVSAARSGGDDSAAVMAGGALTFTSANWSTPQPITIAARRDLDTSDDVATIALQATGLASETVTVHLRDDNSVQVRVSAATLALDEGMTGTFTVALSQQPSLDVAVAVSRTAGDQDLSVSAGGTLTFTRDNWSAGQTVTVSAAADGDSADDTATLSVASEGLPPQTVAVTARDDDPPPPDAAPDGPPDAGPPDAPAADAPIADAPLPDAAPRDTATDSRPTGGLPDAVASPDSSARTPVSTGGGSGCDCRAGGSEGAAGGHWLAGWLFAVLLFQRRKNACRRTRQITPR